MAFANVPLQRRFGDDGFGQVSLISLIPSAAGTGASLIATAAGAGSIIPGLGTAIGAGVGLVASLLTSLFGGGGETAAEKQQQVGYFKTALQDIANRGAEAYLSYDAEQLKEGFHEIDKAANLHGYWDIAQQGMDGQTFAALQSYLPVIEAIAVLDHLKGVVSGEGWVGVSPEQAVMNNVHNYLMSQGVNYSSTPEIAEAIRSGQTRAVLPFSQLSKAGASGQAGQAGLLTAGFSDIPIWGWVLIVGMGLSIVFQIRRE